MAPYLLMGGLVLLIWILWLLGQYDYNNKKTGPNFIEMFDLEDGTK